MRILIIEDDPGICNLLEESFTDEGFQVKSANDGIHGVECALSGAHDFIILDILLPGLDGFEVLRRIRKKSEVPVLILTVANQDQQRIKGLLMGADDYLNKPFNLDELLARIQAISRRTSKQVNSQSPELITVGDIVVNTGSRRAYRDGEEINLTAAEFNLLEVLLSKAGQVIPREELVLRVQGRHHTPYDRSIDVHISRLRKKLSRHADGSDRIKAVRGIGHYYSMPTVEGFMKNPD